MSHQCFSRFLFGIFVFCMFATSPVHVQAEANTNSLDFLATYQTLDGGLTEEGQTESQNLQSEWATIAFASSGVDPNTIVKNNVSLLDFILSKACSYTNVTDIERSILALRSANVNLSTLGCDLSQKLEAFVNQETGQIGDSAISTIYGILAFSSYGHEIPDNSVDYLKSIQENGGWNSGWGVDANTTAQAVMALTSASVPSNDESLQLAKDYLKSLQDETGGIRYDTNDWTSYADSFSSAYTIQAIYALGENPTSSYWTKNNKTALDFLLTLKQANGSYNYSPDPVYGAFNPVWTTAVVLPALNQKTLPVINQTLTPFTTETEPTTPEAKPENVVQDNTEPETVIAEVDETPPAQQETQEPKTEKITPPATLISYAQNITSEPTENITPQEDQASETPETAEGPEKKTISLQNNPETENSTSQIAGENWPLLWYTLAGIAAGLIGFISYNLFISRR